MVQKRNFFGSGEESTTKKAKPAPSTASKKEQRKEKEDGLDLLLFKFLNDRALPDSVAQDQKLRDIIDYCIENAADLSEYTHMGKRKYAAIRCSAFSEFKEHVTGILNDIRKYYDEMTVSRDLFLHSLVFAPLTRPYCSRRHSLGHSPSSLLLLTFGMANESRSTG